MFIRQAFIILSFVIIIMGIMKITIASMLQAWGADFSGFVFVTYKPEITGATLSGIFDLSFSLYGLKAIFKNDARLLFVFSLNMIFVSLAKAAQVYLCSNHKRRIPFILRYEVELIWIKYSYLDEAVNITNRVQSQFSCCGAFDPSSWKRDGMDLLPRSCCGKVSKCTFEYAHKKGCYQALLERVKFQWIQFLCVICVPALEVIHLIVACIYSTKYAV